MFLLFCSISNCPLFSSMFFNSDISTCIFNTHKPIKILGIQTTKRTIETCFFLNSPAVTKCIALCAVKVFSLLQLFSPIANTSMAKCLIHILLQWLFTNSFFLGQGGVRCLAQWHNYSMKWTRQTSELQSPQTIIIIKKNVLDSDDIVILHALNRLSIRTLFIPLLWILKDLMYI